MNRFKNTNKSTKFFLAFVFSSAVFASPPKKLILSDARLLEDAKIKILQRDDVTGLATALISPLQESMLSRKSHELGRCAGFELLAYDSKGLAQNQFDHMVAQIKARQLRDQKKAFGFKRLRKRGDVATAIDNVNAANIQEWVKWLSSYFTRYHRGVTPNEHVEALKAKLDELLAKYPALHAETSLIDHNNTPQKTIRVHIPGAVHPDEIVVLGAHLDSINMGIFGPSSGAAPGADDDASGAAALLEAMRNVLDLAPFDRSLEFFFYAGEEGGLLGSAEIAKSYKQQNKKVVGVLQLDMVLFPGSGTGHIASMTDFTSPEMRDLLAEINRTYLNINIIDDKCGYGCSDHASWYRNGYPTLMPSEATFDEMNHSIHSAQDVINATSDFDHAAIFGKIAVGFISHLATPEN